MSQELLSSQDAARRLGIRPATLYDWLAQSDAGTFMIRGQSTTINYFQGGRKGQGRIQIEDQEVERLLDLMKVQPKTVPIRRPLQKPSTFQHITTKPGRPDD